MRSTTQFIKQLDVGAVQQRRWSRVANAKNVQKTSFFDYLTSSYWPQNLVKLVAGRDVQWPSSSCKLESPFYLSCGPTSRINWTHRPNLTARNRKALYLLAVNWWGLLLSGWISGSSLSLVNSEFRRCQNQLGFLHERKWSLCDAYLNTAVW